jgi:hypothetical protein
VKVTATINAVHDLKIEFIVDLPFWRLPAKAGAGLRCGSRADFKTIGSLQWTSYRSGGGLVLTENCCEISGFANSFIRTTVSVFPMD